MNQAAKLRDIHYLGIVKAKHFKKRMWSKDYN